MSASPSVAVSPYLLARVAVTRVQQLSPSFIRITFGGDDLAEFGPRDRVLDQRIKLIFPSPGATLPEFILDAEWYQSWLALPEETRGSMRTYSIRDLVIGEDATEVVVDFVLHLAPGSSGPASLWASGASRGDEILILGPRREFTEGGGIEYAPGDARTILLAGDETAAPAIARILEDSPADARGVAFIEVPGPDDVLPIAAPVGVEVRWLPRSGALHGTVLLPAVLDYLGAVPVATIEEVASEDLLWETPTFSGLGEELPSAENHADRYFWIAGESGVVTTLRRHLVRDLGIDRSQVAFMGYWRKGVAMRG